MRSVITTIVVLFVLFACQPSGEVSQEEPSAFQNGISWGSDNEIANYLAFEGISHWQNIEFEKAYVLWEEALELDSSLFACHTALALMSRGEKRAYHKEMANKFVAGENETSKLFVSLLDVEEDSTASAKRREIWAKMHELSNGPYIHFRYAMSREDTLEALDEINKLEDILSSLKMNTAHTYNLRGYLYNMMGDLSKGSEEIENYMRMYPEGYNPLDSRAEFYLFAGDTAMAVEFYKKTRERFPYSTSARNALRMLQE